jgi:hypothetical protein
MANIPKTVIGLFLPLVAAIVIGALLGLGGGLSMCGVSSHGLVGAMLGAQVFGFFLGVPGAIIGSLIGVIIDHYSGSPVPSKPTVSSENQPANESGGFEGPKPSRSRHSPR